MIQDNFPLNPQASGYDSGTAYALGLVSKLVYTQFEKDKSIKEYVQATARSWGFSQVECFESAIRGDKDNDAEAILLSDAERLVVGFRGTEQKWEEWVKTDAFAKKVQRFQPKMIVHQGFYDALSAIWYPKGKIEKPEHVGIRKLLLEKLEEGPKSIWITGHSLGGAMAVLAAASCCFDEPKIDVAGLYTYGKPRVGNRPFANGLDAALPGRIYRIVNNNDVVARIPSFRYKHAGSQKYFDSDRNLQDGKEMGFFAKLADRIRGRAQDVGDPLSDGVKDHFLGEPDQKEETYLSLLKEQWDRVG